MGGHIVVCLAIEWVSRCFRYLIPALLVPVSFLVMSLVIICCVMCGSVGIKHRHNLVRDTLLDICYRYGISAGMEVDIGLVDGHGRPLRPVDLLLYSWDRGRDVCVDLTGSSPLTQTGMTDFVPGRVVADAAQRKCVKYRDLCMTVGYGFLPFSFSSPEELDTDAVALLKRIQKFSIFHDTGARAAACIFTKLSFSMILS
ncbi:unnamed protein product [Linum trigynum]|uniref:Uncharacterized protein n=1 Tax=Linum trigynum TaxID=586398 RepID=A0AAV2G3K2_9ROSI